jgi:hypothetical protein
MTHVKALLDGLCNFYTIRGEPHRMNEMQVEVYVAALERFTPEELDRAGKQCMLRMKFFPALAELIELLVPKTETSVMAHDAWSSVERAIRSAGVYRGAKFQSGAVGETVRRVFGNWATACQFDIDSPGWAIRRQTFLALFPEVLKHHDGSPVTLLGVHHNTPPLEVAALPSLPTVAALPSSTTPYSHQEAVGFLAELEKRR